jgi:ribonuclease P protein component
MKLFTFNKNERLVHRTEIDNLFHEGLAFNVSPLRIFYQSRDTAGIKVLVSVPKKKFRRAVHRNRIKRLIRESYRLHKTPLHEKYSIDDSIKGLNIAFVYIGDKADIAFQEIERAMISAIHKL